MSAIQPASTEEVIDDDREEIRDLRHRLGNLEQVISSMRRESEDRDRRLMMQALEAIGLHSSADRERARDALKFVADQMERSKKWKLELMVGVVRWTIPTALGAIGTWLSIHFHIGQK